MGEIKFPKKTIESLRAHSLPFITFTDCFRAVDYMHIRHLEQRTQNIKTN